MGVEFAAERRLLAETELGPVRSSHYPELDGLEHAALVDLAHWLRGQHGRARDIIRDRRRVRRGKAEPRGAAAETPSERGLAAKKQVFARALKRVNARLGQLAAASRHARAVAFMRDALERKRAVRPHHPTAGRSAGKGMRVQQNRTTRPVVHGARIGSVSQAGRVAQASHDARNG